MSRNFIHYSNAFGVDLRFRASAAFQFTYCMRMGSMPMLQLSPYFRTLLYANTTLESIQSELC